MRKSTQLVIVSMTSMHSRMNDLHQTIESILAQTSPADEVILWLSKKPYLLDEGVHEIPETLKKLTSKGLSIMWTDNTGPYRKLIPTVELKKGTDCLIITADDDVVYPNDWLDGLLKEYEQNENCVICYRGRIITKETGIKSFLRNSKLKTYVKWPRTHEVEDKSMLGPNMEVFPTGKDGVLYPIASLSDKIFETKTFQELAPTNDDIWFKAMTMLTGTKVKCIDNHLDFPEIESARDSRLYAFSNKKNNDVMIKKVFKKLELL